MPELSLSGLASTVADRIRPFLDDILNQYAAKIHSVYITGSAVTDDFDEKMSDVNSVFVLQEMDLQFLELIAPLGKKYRKQNVAAPLIMTPGYIRASLDVFPIEFLNFRLIHATVYGEDVFQHIECSGSDLRYQCERELKVKLIGLRQGYLSTMGDRNLLAEGLIKSITGYFPLFRGVIVLLGGTPPVRQRDVIQEMSRLTSINTDVFARVLRAKREQLTPSLDELKTIFEDYYAATEKLGSIVDEINA